MGYDDSYFATCRCTLYSIMYKLYMQVTKPVGDNMVRQITVTFGQNDQELTEFLMKRESVSNADAITGINIRNQLYELMRMIEPIR